MPLTYLIVLLLTAVLAANAHTWFPEKMTPASRRRAAFGLLVVTLLAAWSREQAGQSTEALMTLAFGLTALAIVRTVGRRWWIGEPASES